MLSEPAVELRSLSRGPGGQVRGQVSTPVVSSPGRQSLQSQYTPASLQSSSQQYTPASQYNTGAPTYSQARSTYAPSTTYNPGYQEQPPVNRRYLSEGELLGDMSGQVQGVIPSTSAGHLQVTEMSTCLNDEV